jgi:GMP synthase (glutamine-hydrolysing)
VPVLGICLGHQLAAVALGGTVERNPHGQQVGLFTVGWFAEAHLDPLMASVATPRRGVQWNDDIVSALPPGAVALARTPQGELQAARFAPTVWGVQHHPEVDVDILRLWAKNDRERHLSQGLDPDAVLEEIDAARGELDAAWQPMAERFVEVAAHHR